VLPIELYWAFPGRYVFSHLSQLYAGREVDRLERLVGAIVRALASESYRSRSINLLALEDDAEGGIDDGFAESDADRVVAGERPYFEVLVVDKLAEETERVMRENLRQTRRAEDRFVYDIVVVPSFEDALIAVLFNYNIQAVVVRYSFFK
jgi:arginine decarboxylase